MQDDSDPHTGKDLHEALGGYNENGVINGEEIGGDADSAAFVLAATQVYNYVPPEDQSQMMFANTLIAV